MTPFCRAFFPSSDCGRGAHVLRARSAPRSRLSRLLPFVLWQFISCIKQKHQTSKSKAQLRLCFFFVKLRVCCSCTFEYTPLRMLAFRDFRRLLCVCLSLCFKNAPFLVLVFLGSCRLLFGKSPLCKQKSSVQDVQQKHGDLPCFLI